MQGGSLLTSVQLEDVSALTLGEDWGLSLYPESLILVGSPLVGDEPLLIREMSPQLVWATPLQGELYSMVTCREGRQCRSARPVAERQTVDPLLTYPRVYLYMCTRTCAYKGGSVPEQNEKFSIVINIIRSIVAQIVFQYEQSVLCTEKVSSNRAGCLVVRNTFPMQSLVYIGCSWS